MDGGLIAGVVELIFESGDASVVGVEVDHAGEASFLGFAELGELFVVRVYAAGVVGCVVWGRVTRFAFQVPSFRFQVIGWLGLIFVFWFWSLGWKAGWGLGLG